MDVHAALIGLPLAGLAMKWDWISAETFGFLVLWMAFGIAAGHIETSRSDRSRMVSKLRDIEAEIQSLPIKAEMFKTAQRQ